MNKKIFILYKHAVKKAKDNNIAKSITCLAIVFNGIFLIKNNITNTIRRKILFTKLLYSLLLRL